VAVLISTSARAAEVSMPITWNARGWILRYIPADEPFFMDGGIVATLDIVAVDANRMDVFFYIGAGFFINMGQQDEGVVFDPRDAHYSMIGGFRFEVESLMFNVEWLHDCFHDIDRYDDKTQIWNVAKFDFYNRNWFPRYRREAWKQRTGTGLIFDYGYLATAWYFPQSDASEWVQHEHDFSTAWGGGLKLAFAHWRNNALEFRPNILYFYDRAGDWSHRNNVFFYATHYGRGGTAALFGGYQWDSQDIKPSGERWIVGLDFYL